MTRVLKWAGVLLAAWLAVPQLADAACQTPVPRPRDATPERLYWPPWRTGVEQLTERLRPYDLSGARLAFVGDSITQWWDPGVFQRFYGRRAAVNLGVGGDATQGTLWRLDNGNWPARLHPATIVLLIGTNNLGLGSRPEDVAGGIAEVIAKLQQLAGPQVKILLLGILPRGASPTDPMRPLVARVNQLIAVCADNQRVFFADPGPALLDATGQLSPAISPDGVHLSPAGYERLSAQIEPHLGRILR
ncbi:GDSL-type esterase/lipase family protein [Roseococcus sp. YIM B11640]|uniref:GDSL-type esterase/lipase family protein n=1 Tax=Roseococcus sp. YIM B11640 TaxID=3133973 RepID=UPI003C7C5936